MAQSASATVGATDGCRATGGESRMNIHLHKYRVRNHQATRLMVTIPLLGKTIHHPDGTKTVHTHSITRHLWVVGKVITMRQGDKNILVGHVNEDNEYVWQFPDVISDAHEAYEHYKRRMENPNLRYEAA
jgi:hypothetical protein